MAPAEAETASGSHPAGADYLICGISEGNGVKWKGGNPVPHLFYDREREDAGAMTPLSQFTNNTEH